MEVAICGMAHQLRERPEEEERRQHDEHRITPAWSRWRRGMRSISAVPTSHHQLAAVEGFSVTAGALHSIPAAASGSRTCPSRTSVWPAATERPP